MPTPPLSRRLRWWAAKPKGLVVSVQAYRWARRELADVKVRLKTEGVKTRVVPPTGLAPRGYRGLQRALAQVSPTCLERALVLQAWRAAYTDAPDVVIGVRKGESDIEAHAWVEGDTSAFDPSYDELTRLTFSG
jgi:hypothetical protein